MWAGLGVIQAKLKGQTTGRVEGTTGDNLKLGFKQSRGTLQAALGAIETRVRSQFTKVEPSSLSSRHTDLPPIR